MIDGLHKGTSYTGDPQNSAEVLVIESNSTDTAPSAQLKHAAKDDLSKLPMFGQYPSILFLSMYFSNIVGVPTSTTFYSS